MSHPTASAAAPKKTPEEQQKEKEQKEQQQKDDATNAIAKVLAELGAKAGLGAGARIVLEFPVPDNSSVPSPPTLVVEEDDETKAEKAKAKKEKEKKAKEAKENALKDIESLFKDEPPKKDQTPEEKQAAEQQAAAQAALAQTAQWTVWRGVGSAAHVGSGHTLAYALKVIDAVVVSKNGALALVSQDGSDLPKDEDREEREAREAKEKEAQDAAAKKSAA